MSDALTRGPKAAGPPATAEAGGRDTAPARTKHPVRAVRLADVAHAAGVSVMTASRVANAVPTVTPENRARVLAAMSALGYTANVAARALKTGRPMAIGLVLARPSSTAPARLLFEIEAAAGAAGYDIHVVTVKDFTVEGIRTAIDRMESRRVSAVILLSLHASTREVLASVRSQTPLVVVWGNEELQVPSVRIDHQEAARTATQHLLDLGHPTVRHVAGPQDWALSEMRIRGWMAALSEAGCQPAEVLRGDWSPKSGYAAGIELLRDPSVSAVFVANDAMAMGLLAAARDLGRQLPAQLSVVGFDDEPAVEYSAPPLTTIRLDHREVGRAAFAVTRELIEEGPDGGASILVPTRLVVRGSTAPYAGAG